MSRSRPGPGWPDDRAVALATVAPLGRREARALALHPAFLIGLIVLPGLILLMAGAEPDPEARPIIDNRDLALVPVLTAWAVIVASGMAVLRNRRYSTEELWASLPTTPITRTSAHLVATLVGLPAGLAVLVASLILAWAQGETGSPLWTDILVAPLIVMGAGVVGVAVARWLPRAVFLYAAILAVTVLQTNLWYGDDRWRWLHFSTYGNDPPVAFDALYGRVEWHLVYVVGLIAFAGLLALVRHGWSTAATGVAIAAAVLVAPAAWVQTRPYAEADVARILSRLEEPDTYQVCQVHGGVTYCAHPREVAAIETWTGPVGSVLERVPADAVPADLEVRQRPTIELLDQAIPDGVRRPLEADPTRVWIDDGHVHPSGWVDASYFGELRLAYQAASAVVGLPVTWTAGTEQCLASGQARSVVALWLAGSASTGSTDSLRNLAAESAPGEPVHLDDTNIDTTSLVLEHGSVLDPADLVAAVALVDLDLSAAQVHSLLSQHWDEVVDPATPADRVLAWAGADPARAVEPLSGGDARPCPSTRGVEGA